MQRSNYNLIPFSKVSYILLVDFLNDLLQWTEGFRHFYRLFQLGRFINTLFFFHKTNGTFISFFKIVILKFHSVTKVKRHCWISRQNLRKVRTKDIFIMHLFIKHTDDLCNVSIPFYKCSAQFTELVSLFLIQCVVLLLNR